jgi:hypothetical protein
MDFIAEIQAVDAHSRDVLQCSEAIKAYRKSLQQLVKKDMGFCNMYFIFRSCNTLYLLPSEDCHDR